MLEEAGRIDEAQRLRAGLITDGALAITGAGAVVVKGSGKVLGSLAKAEGGAFDVAALTKREEQLIVDQKRVVGGGTNGAATGTASTKILAQYGPLNAGPLPSDFASTFRSGTYAEVVTQKPTVLYRVYGGAAGEFGGYWSGTAPSGPVQSIIYSALNPQWGNNALNVVKIEVPSGVTFYQGTAASQGGLVGGGNQVLFPPGFKVDPSWIVKP